MAENAVTNPLWDYSLTVYRGRVVTLCLRLQDDCGIDVNLLLYAAWLAQQGRLLTAEHLAAQEMKVSDWRARVVQPLRTLRRDLRDFAPAAALREHLAELELLAERTVQDILYAGSAATQGPPTPSPACAEATAAMRQLRAQLELVAVSAGAEQSLWEPLIDTLVPLLAAGDPAAGAPAAGAPGVAPRSGR